jgi:phosphoserine phosphatase RsbU/P
VSAATKVRARSKAAGRGQFNARSELSAAGEITAHGGQRWRRALALMLALVVAAVAVVVDLTGPGIMPPAWLAVGPLLASLALSPLVTAMLSGWSLLLGIGLVMGQLGRPGVVASHLGVLLLLAGFAVANSALRTAAQRRITEVRAVARVAQSAILREVPATVTAGRLASRYVSASPEARVGGDLLDVVAGPGHPRWLIGDTRGKGLPAVRLASVAGEEDFVTAVFAEFDPHGWLQLVVCGHPPPLRLTADGDLRALTPAVYATPLGLHPDLQPSTFTVNVGDRLVFYTDGLLEARDRAGRYFRLEDCLDTLSHPDLQAAADELLSRLLAHARRKLDDDVALLLVEATSPAAGPDTDPARGIVPGRSASPDGSSLVLARASLAAITATSG